MPLKDTEHNQRMEIQAMEAHPDSVDYLQSLVDLDFYHWSRMASWTLEEAVFLSLGIDPEAYERTPEQQSADLRKREQLVSRAAKASVLSSPTTPPEFIGWALANEISFPAELQRLVLTRCSKWVNWKHEAEKQLDRAERAEDAFRHYKHQAGKKERQLMLMELEVDTLRRKIESTRQNGGSEISPKSFNTLLRLVGGMAISIYNYNPEDSRSDTVSQIRSDLHLKGVNIDADTVRKWIRKGATFVMTARDA